MLSALRSRIVFYFPIRSPPASQPETSLTPIINGSDLKQSEVKIEGEDYFVVYEDPKKAPSIFDILNGRSKLESEFSDILSAMDKSCLRALPRISTFIALINTIIDYSENNKMEEKKVLQNFFRCIIPLANNAKSKIYFNHVVSLFCENFYCEKVILLWLNTISEFKTEKFYPLIIENLNIQIENNLRVIIIPQNSRVK